MGANLKEVRERISSVSSTQQITKAMKMVSASKLRKAQQAIIQIRPYANRLNKMLTNILSNLEGDASSSFGQIRPINNDGVIVLATSDRGLCGAFNTNVIKQVIELINGDLRGLYDEGNLSIIPVGKKGYDGLKKKFPKANFITDYVNLYQALSFDKTSELSSVLMDHFQNETYDIIQVCFGRFKNAAVQFAETDQFLPVKRLEKDPKLSKGHRADYIFEPNKETLLEHLIPSILQTKFHKYLLDTQASEHGARMTAMDKATENAEEMLKDLKITYNKARQESITSELSEIVGGAAALEGA